MNPNGESTIQENNGLLSYADRVEFIVNSVDQAKRYRELSVEQSAVTDEDWSIIVAAAHFGLRGRDVADPDVRDRLQYVYGKAKEMAFDGDVRWQMRAIESKVGFPAHGTRLDNVFTNLKLHENSNIVQ